MQEFESISASSYDPSALATKLTAKAADGWSVVAIVPTGGDVTAFVSREKSGADDSSKPADTSEPAKPKAEEEDSSLVLPAKSESAADADTEPKPEPVSEPSGWAIAPEPATPPAEPTSPQPAVTVQPGSSYQPGGAPSYEPAAAATPAAATPAAATPAAASPAAPAPAAATPASAAATPASAAPAVPAGWYADPAGRFELRYWDGSNWTEHVSRSGQQFTDPPVA